MVFPFSPIVTRAADPRVHQSKIFPMDCRASGSETRFALLPGNDGSKAR
ncbi:hypothetical protein [Bradyrhizobium sp. Tv2a-2]|nr:hypothetical protein [Bradyrhizobium sp. Tv2a-2]